MPTNPTQPSTGTPLERTRMLSERVRWLETELELTRSALRDAWLEVPPMEIRHERPCHVCKRPTFDMLQERPHCLRYACRVALVHAALRDD